ncbi:MAG: hypothetical protein WAX80_01760 [Minisyncoccia bacterium]
MKDKVKEAISLFKDRVSLIIFFDLLFMALPGVLVVFNFDKDLFMSIDWVKLILLATSITLPVSFVDTIFILGIMEKKISKEEGLFFAFSIGSILAGLTFFVALLIQELNLPYSHNFITLVILINIIIIFCVWINERLLPMKIISNFQLWGTKDNPESLVEIESNEPVQPQNNE